MTKLPALALAGLAAFALTACAGGMEVVSANSDAVTIRHSVDRNSDADSRATTECQNYGKKARLRSSHSDSTTDVFSIFDCVPM